MSVWHEKSDLFTSKAGILAHGCNCRGAYGSGVAGLMRQRHPQAYEAYKELHETTGLELGTVQFVPIEVDKNHTIYIANCMTQDNYGTHQRQVNYEAIYTCFGKLRDFAEEKKIGEVALCQIGAGLAGGSWPIIETMLRVQFDKTDVQATFHTIN